MAKFDVHVETFDRRSAFTVEWEADSEQAIVDQVRREGGVDSLNDDGAFEWYPLAGIRRLSITPTDEPADA